MKCSRTEKSPWNLNAKQSQEQTKRKSINFILIEGKISPKVTIKGSWFSQLSESKAACASSLDVSVVSKKKIVGAKKAEAMLRESYFQEQAQIILHRRIFHCPKRVTP